MTGKNTIGATAPSPPPHAVGCGIADMFRAAASRLVMEFPLADGQSFRMLSIPGIWCLAHATELYFKVLLTSLKANHASSWKRTHNLEQLYGSLPKAIQDELLQLMGITAQDFNRHLATIANASVTYRYVHEGPTMGVFENFVKGLTEAVRELAYTSVGLRHALTAPTWGDSIGGTAPKWSQ